MSGFTRPFPARSLLPRQKTDGRLDRLKTEISTAGFCPPSLFPRRKNGKNTLLSTYTSTAVLAFSTSENPLPTAHPPRTLHDGRPSLGFVGSARKLRTGRRHYPSRSICSAGIWRNDNPPDVQSIRSQETNDLISKSKDVLAQNKVVALTVAYETETDKAAVNYTVQNWQKAVRS